MTRNAEVDETETCSTRRRFLAGVACGTPLLAGCLGLGRGRDRGGEADDDGSGNGGAGESDEGVTADDVPDFSADGDTDPRPVVLAAEPLAAPENIESFDRFDVEVAIGNVGGGTISSRSIEIAPEYVYNTSNPGNKRLTEPSPTEVTLPEVGSGEWKTVETEVRVNSAGDWTLEADVRQHPDFEFQITADPKRLTPGDSVTSETYGFEITALKPRYERALRYDYKDAFGNKRPALTYADDGDVLVVHRFTVESTSGQSIGFGSRLVDTQFPRAFVNGQPGTVVPAEDLRGDLVGLQGAGIDQLFANNKIAPGGSKDLGVLQQVAESDVSSSSLALSVFGYGNDIVFETIGEAPALPAFDLLEAGIDDSGEGDPVISMSVENTGEAPGTFRGAAQDYDPVEVSDWVFLREIVERDLAPGDTATLEITASFGVSSFGENRFRILPFEREVEL